MASRPPSQPQANSTCLEVVTHLPSTQRLSMCRLWPPMCPHWVCLFWTMVHHQLTLLLSCFSWDLHPDTAHQSYTCSGNDHDGLASVQPVFWLWGEVEKTPNIFILFGRLRVSCHCWQAVSKYPLWFVSSLGLPSSCHPQTHTPVCHLLLWNTRCVPALCVLTHCILTPSCEVELLLPNFTGEGPEFTCEGSEFIGKGPRFTDEGPVFIS